MKEGLISMMKWHLEAQVIIKEAHKIGKKMNQAGTSVERNFGRSQEKGFIQTMIRQRKRKELSLQRKENDARLRNKRKRVKVGYNEMILGVVENSWNKYKETLQSGIVKSYI